MNTIIQNELVINKKEYPSQFSNDELFKFFLRRHNGKMLAENILHKMILKMSPLKNIQICFDQMVNGYICMLEHMLSINRGKIKMMQKGLIIPKPKILKNGYHYFDKEEINTFLQKLIFREIELVLHNENLPTIQFWWESWDTIKLKKLLSSEFLDYFFRLLNSLFLSIKTSKLFVENDLDIQEFFIVWALRLNKFELLKQYVQNLIFSENLELSLFLCEFSSFTSVLPSIMSKLKMINPEKNYLSPRNTAHKLS